MITVHINGESREVPDSLSLATLVDWLNLPADRLAIEHNLEVVPRHRWQEVRVLPDDRLEMVHFVGGG
jgi:sulfur carrier protein